MENSAKKQEVYTALNGITYNEWMEIKFKVDRYFNNQLRKYENQLKLNSQQANANY